MIFEFDDTKDLEQHGLNIRECYNDEYKFYENYRFYWKEELVNSNELIYSLVIVDKETIMESNEKTNYILTLPIDLVLEQIEKLEFKIEIRCDYSNEYNECIVEVNGINIVDHLNYAALPGMSFAVTELVKYLLSKKMVTLESGVLERRI